MALLFMTVFSTILQVMQNNIADIENFDLYKDKIYSYEAVYDEIINQFSEDMFGPYFNSVDKASFLRCLSLEGWKYFDLIQLN